ncbi:MAG TPA: PrgI family protein [Patescibacteria group bacterium]|nr:PrgI family protein [Patescibacteria group bacterium]
MEQHPIPQNISSYQFRLVGDMTLKQFFQLAGGLLVALIFYSAPLLPIIKWPFVIVSAILGVALAFLPLEERPLERWIFAFFKAIYSPTMYFWQKNAVVPKLFQDEPVENPQGALSPQDLAAKEYLSTTGQKSGPLAKLEGVEKGFLAGLSNIFAGITGQTTAPAVAIPNIQAGIPVQPVGMQIGINTGTTPAVVEPKKEMQIPESVPVRIAQVGVPHLIVEEKKQNIIPEAQLTTHQVAPLIAGDEIISTKQAIFSVDAAPPNPPTVPNVIVGQVVDENRKIIEGAIMEIKDSAGRPIRALRSNKVGHFITITPLESGRYDVITEKDGYTFTPISFEAIGVLIPPILVSGRKLPANSPQTAVYGNQQTQPVNSVPTTVVGSL